MHARISLCFKALYVFKHPVLMMVILLWDALDRGGYRLRKCHLSLCGWKRGSVFVSVALSLLSLIIFYSKALFQIPYISLDKIYYDVLLQDRDRFSEV